MVECNLAKVEVAGSNPVSRSIGEFRVVLKTTPFFVDFLCPLQYTSTLWIKLLSSHQIHAVKKKHSGKPQLHVKFYSLLLPLKIPCWLPIAPDPDAIGSALAIRRLSLA